MPAISIIAAIAANRAIGKDNRLLCHLPADLKHFKHLTAGHSVIMGRKTFESLPNGALPGRKNIVISSQALSFTNCVIAHSLENALEICKNEDETFIIGGANVYRQAINIADTLYITVIHRSFDADTFFPDIDSAKWHEIERIDFEADETNPYNYSFVKYVTLC